MIGAAVALYYLPHVVAAIVLGLTTSPIFIIGYLQRKNRHI